MTLCDIGQFFKRLPYENQGGSLAFFGCWFGGRPDGVAMLKSVSFNEEMLILDFLEGERVEISGPSDVEVLEDALIIWRASSVVCYWDNFGEMLSPESRKHYRFKVVDDKVQVSTNHKHSIIPQKGAPAFEMAWYVHPDFSGPEYNRERGKIRR